MAGRPSLARGLDVWMNGEPVGSWSVSPRDGHAFAYAAEWLLNTNRRPLSLSLPLTRETSPFRGALVESYFDNLLPDSRAIRARLARRHHVGASQAFQLLEAIGRDCVGAVQLLPAGSPAPQVKRIEATPVNEAGIVALLDQALSDSPRVAGGEDELRISLAGAQEKTALLWHAGHWCVPHGATPTTHIFKLPLGRVGAVQADFTTSVENEWLCSRVLDAFGLPVATCGMTAFGSHKVLVVERFDRKRFANWWGRLPQEDFCQALGVPPEHKYETDGGPGIDAILDRLRGSVTADADRRTFLKAQLIFWLLAAPDGHAKNFSIFIEQQGRFRLTPLYDVMSAWPVIGRGPKLFDRKKLRLAMAVNGKNRHSLIDSIRRRHWNETAKRNALGLDFEPVIAEVLAALPAVLERVSAELPAGFPTQVSGSIFEGMVAQARRLKAMPV
jgi:serine/threonine-protein kinase HipA